MNHLNLSTRLQTVADFIPENARLADIGSDHAYLPCYLALQNKIAFAVAGEVVKGPFESAKNHVSQLQLNDRIVVRLADGLFAIESDDAIDTITICGMGGDLIASILDTGAKQRKLENVQTLILQPNVDEHSVRRWLMAHHYTITNEVILEENGKIYEVIVAKRSDHSIEYSEDECVFGIFLPEEKSPIFIKKWTNEIKKYDYVLQQLKKSVSDEAEKTAFFEAKIAKIKEYIS